MQWTKPEFEEIRLCCEINSYACASLGQARDQRREASFRPDPSGMRKNAIS